uniref:Uncharacterized protein n=1 Tax=Arundo donax TaxID=35708 RepID=A0A0A8Z279_ARUDO
MNLFRRLNGYCFIKLMSAIACTLNSFKAASL